MTDGHSTTSHCHGAHLVRLKPDATYDQTEAGHYYLGPAKAGHYVQITQIMRSEKDR